MPRRTIQLALLGMALLIVLSGCAVSGQTSQTHQRTLDRDGRSYRHFLQQRYHLRWVWATRMPIPGSRMDSARIGTAG